MCNIRNILSEICRRGYIDLIKYLHEMCEENYLDNDMLQRAIYDGNIESIKYICENGNNINLSIMDDSVDMCGNKEVIKYLYENGYCDVHIMRDILYDSCKNGNIELLKYLCENYEYSTQDIKIGFMYFRFNRHHDCLTYLCQNYGDDE